MLSASARSGFWFLVIGASASLTHIAVFELTKTRIWPEAANACGFVLAFFVSFFGHRYLSFAGTVTGVQTSLLRFAVTALAGFAANELVFVSLLRLLDWHSTVALIAGLAVAAVQTFVLSRYWAFKR